MMANDNKRKKVALFACHDLVGLLILNGLVPAMIAMGMEPIIFNTTNRRNKRFKVPTPPLVATLNVRLLEEVIFPFLENASGTHAARLTYRQLAEKYGLQYQEAADINAPAFVNRLTQDRDIIGGISIRFLQVFSPETIEAFRAKGFMWNLHSGLLGKYKGLLLPYRAIANGEKEYGVTLHETTSGIDEGGIIKKGILPLDPSKPVMDLYLDLVDTATHVITTALDQLRRAHPLPAIPQDKSGTENYYSNPTSDEFKDFAARGIFYIDPVTTIQRIADTFARPGTTGNKRLYSLLNNLLEGENKLFAFHAGSQHQKQATVATLKEVDYFAKIAK